MQDIRARLKQVPDLTTNGLGVAADADALVYQRPTILKTVPGRVWNGRIGSAQAVIRLPDPDHWNGKLMIGATPAVRSEYSLDLLLADLVLQDGYAYAACDKGTPMLVLRDPLRQMTEWSETYRALTECAQDLVGVEYGTKAARTYIAGVSNGGYVVRAMMERFPNLYDGAVEWEGVMWSAQGRHLLTCLPVYVQDYPVVANWRGDRTLSERSAAMERLVEAGLHPDSEPYWSQYFMMYWVVSLWLYGRNLDPDWKGFEADWNNDWLQNPTPLLYDWQARSAQLEDRILPISNTGILEKPLLSVAGNWDCLVPFRHNAASYKDLVAQSGCGANHRLYEIDKGNHVDGLLRANLGAQQPVHPYFEAALHYLEAWVEQQHEPPASGLYSRIDEFAPNMVLRTVHSEDEGNLRRKGV